MLMLMLMLMQQSLWTLIYFPSRWCWAISTTGRNPRQSAVSEMTTVCRERSWCWIFNAFFGPNIPSCLCMQSSTSSTMTMERKLMNIPRQDNVSFEDKITFKDMCIPYTERISERLLQEETDALCWFGLNTPSLPGPCSTSWVPKDQIVCAVISCLRALKDLKLNISGMIIYSHNCHTT